MNGIDDLSWRRYAVRGVVEHSNLEYKDTTGMTNHMKTVQTPFPAAVSRANLSIDILLHITALEGHFDVTISLNTLVLNSEYSEKTAWFGFNFTSFHAGAEKLYSTVHKKNQLDVTFVFCISLLIVAQHVSGNHVPIIRSWRLRDVIASCWYFAVAAGRLSRSVGR